MLYYNIINYIGPNHFKFVPPPDQVIYLISGSISFLNERRNTLRDKQGLCITEITTRCRKLPPPYKRLTHSNVGGATTFELLYCYLASTHDPVCTTLKRNIGDFMDYSIPPSSTSTSSLTLSYKGRLPIRYLHREVLYPTHFSTTGFGYRALTPIELTKIFGLDILLDIGSSSIIQASQFPVVPVPMLDALIAPLLAYTSTTRPSEPINLPPIYHDIGYTWLPVINKRLPNKWYHQVATSTSAVKHDDADVETSIWNQRVTLIFPQCQDHHLHILRRFLLQILFRKLYLEFKTFILTKYQQESLLIDVNGRLLCWSLKRGG